MWPEMDLDENFGIRVGRGMTFGSAGELKQLFVWVPLPSGGRGIAVSSAGELRKLFGFRVRRCVGASVRGCVDVCVCVVACGVV